MTSCEQFLKVSHAIRAVLPAAGWTVVSNEGDNVCQNKYCCSRDDGIEGAFTRMELVVTAVQKQDTFDAVHIHFNFFADPARQWNRSLKYAKHLSHAYLDACEEIMMRAWIPIGKSASVRETHNPRSLLIDFGNGELVHPAYQVDIRYHVAIWMTETYDNVVPYRIKSRQNDNPLPLYEGIPEFIDFAISLVEHKPKCDSLAIVAYHLLGDIVHAAEHGLRHYLTLTLEESFLQNSHIGTPYQKWAKFTSEDFKSLDICLKSLIPVLDDIYSEISMVDDSYGAESRRSSFLWFAEFDKRYTSCVVSFNTASLTVSAINFGGWLDVSYMKFGNVYCFKTAPVVTKTEMPVVDRSVLLELQRVGKIRVEKMKTSLVRLAGWLEVNYTMADVIASRRGEKGIARVK